MGYRVPEDISVVGFDDLDIAQMIHPLLTTVQINRKIMSQVAIERLVDAHGRRRKRTFDHPCGGATDQYENPPPSSA